MENLKVNYTEKGNSYWNNNGAYQKEYEELYKALVPDRGRAKTLHGELIRAISRLSYEYYNNGNLNAADLIYDTDCYGEYTDDVIEVEIKPFYSNFIELIREVVDNDGFNLLTGVENVITSDLYNSEAQFDWNFEQYYVHLTDWVVAYIQQTEDSEIPEWYPN